MSRYIKLILLYVSVSVNDINNILNILNVSKQYIVKLVSGQYSQYWEVMILLMKTIKKSINHSTRPEHGGWIN